MLKQLNELEGAAQAALQEAGDEQALAAWRAAYLGKKGAITERVKALTDLPADQRPAYGRRVNEIKRALEAAYDARVEALQAAARDLLSQWVSQNPQWKLPVTMDSWYTQPAFCRFLDEELGLPYAGTLATDDQVLLKKGRRTLEEFANELKEEHCQAVRDGGKPVFHKIGIFYKGEKETYYTYCRTHRIHNYGKQRLVISYSDPDLSGSPRFFNSNRLTWQATGITRIRRHRWPVEVYHEEGKAEGLDKYQVRDFEAISRHIGLVAVTYSLLRATPHDEALLHKLQRELGMDLEGGTPFWRRVSQAQSLWALACFISAGLTQGLTLRQLMAPFLATVCH